MTELPNYGQVKGSSCLVVLSGGQDSVTCLGLARTIFEHVYAIGFNYGQRHSVELTQATKICRDHNIPFETFPIAALKQLGDSALIDTSQDVNDTHPNNDKLPNSFVPGRNAMFLTIAHAYAQKVGSQYIMTGVCETDYSGYPDCRQVFIDKLQVTLNIGYETDIQFLTPLMSLNKAETFALAAHCNFLTVVINDSHTCYLGKRDKLFPWGYGCGECPACKLRAAGFDAFLDSISKGEEG